MLRVQATVWTYGISAYPEEVDWTCWDLSEQIWIDWNGDKAWSACEQIMAETKNESLAHWLIFEPHYQLGVLTFVRDVPIPPDAVAETYMRVFLNACCSGSQGEPCYCAAHLGGCAVPEGPCYLGALDYYPSVPEDGWVHGDAEDRLVRPREHLAITSVSASGIETAIEGVDDPIWVASMDAGEGCQLSTPSRLEPIAGGFQSQGLTLDVTVGSCPDQYQYDPRVEYRWTILTTAPPWSSTEGEGSFTGWTGGIPLTLPMAVGKSTVEIDFDIFNDMNDLIIRGQHVSIPLYVGMKPAMGQIGAPKRLWLDKATTWAYGGYSPRVIDSLLVGGIYNNGGWHYADRGTRDWSDLLDGSATIANCYTLSNMWRSMTYVLGDAGATVEDTRGRTKGFLTKTDHRQSFDPELAGNAHPHAGAIDRWFFGAHQVGLRGGRYYDPTFNNTFTTRDAFIEWNLIGAFVPGGTIGYGYYPLESGYRAYVMSDRPPWQDIEYSSGEGALAVAPLAAPRAGRNAGGAIIVHTQDAYLFSTSTACTTTYAETASCEEANTRSDKAEGTVIWCLAAFDSTASAEVSGIYFGIDYEDSLSVDRWMICGPAGSVELPDSGWPYEGRGTMVAFGTPIVGKQIFPFYVFGVDGGTEGSYFSTTINPTGGYAAFVDGQQVVDQVTAFGTVRWYADGENSCPSSIGDSLTAAFASPLTWTQVDENADGQAEALRVSGTILVSGPLGLNGDFSWSGQLTQGETFVTSRAGATCAGMTGGSMNGVGAGAHAFAIDFSGEDVRDSTVNGSCSVSLALLGSGGVEDTLRAVSPVLEADSFGEITARIVGVTDQGLDTDASGLYDRLAVDVAIVVTATTGIGLSVTTFPTAGSEPIDEKGTSTTLSSGTHVVRLEINGRAIRASGVDGPYELLIQLRSGDSSLSDTETRPSAAYTAEQFDLPAIELAGQPGESVEHGDDDRITSLLVWLPVNVRLPGEYHVWATLSRGDSTITYATETNTLADSADFVWFRFGGRPIHAAGLDGPYSVSLLRVTGADGEAVLEDRDVYTLDEESADEFESEPVTLVVPTGIYSSAAEDTTGDGLYDDLAFETEVVALEDGTVVASALLYTPSGRLIEWASGSVEAGAGVPATVAIPFSGGKIRARGEDGAYVVRGLHIYHMNGPDLSSDVVEPHSTAPLTAASFRAAPIVVGTVLAGPTTALAGATVYLEPLDDMVLTNAQGYYSLAVSGAGGVPVTVGLVGGEMYPDSTWYTVVNGTYGGTGTRVVVTPDSAEVIEVNFGQKAFAGTGQEPETEVARLHLSQPRPNPLVGSRGLVMDVAAPSGAHLTAAVFDAGGRMVRRLFDGVATGKAEPLTWDGRDARGRPVATGAYLIGATARHHGEVESSSRKVVVAD